MDARGMTEQVKLFAPGTAGVSPETMAQVGTPRRAQIWRVSNDEAIRAEARFGFSTTHSAIVDYATDYVPSGHGSRLLVRRSDGQNFAILKALEEGRKLRGGRYRYMRLLLAEVSPAQVTW